VAERLGAVPLLADLDDLLRKGRLGGGQPGRPAADAFALTGRERDVLELLALGRTNREIGETLFISEKTASVHVSNLIAKLGVANRTEAAAKARAVGLLVAE
jgi:DNA-binding NarL/FixJ family response regulator